MDKRFNILSEPAKLQVKKNNATQILKLGM